MNVNNIQSVEDFEYLLDKISNFDIEVYYVSNKSEEANEYFKLNTDINTNVYKYIMLYFQVLLLSQ